MRALTVLIFGGVFFILAAGTPTVWASCGAAPDPRSNPSGYARWCSCMGGKVYNDARGYGCDTSGKGSSSGSPGYGGTDPWVGLMGNLMNQFMQGFDRGLQQNRNAAIQQQQEFEQHRAMMDQKRKEDEERLRQDEERRRQEFAKSKERMLGLLRSSDFDSIRSRDLRAELEVREVDDVFGTKSLKPKDLTAGTQTVSKDQQTIFCTAYLLKKANEAFSQKKFEEAAYLSNEAAGLMSGAKGSSAVVCPPAPEIPAVQGGPVAESLAMSEKIKKQTLFYSKLYTRASQQMGDYRVVTNSVEQAEQKVEESQKGVEEAEVKKKEIETLKQENPDSVSESAVAEALAALEQAKAIHAEAEKELQDRLHSKAEMEVRLNETRHLFEGARENPEKIEEMMGQVR